MQTAEPKPVTTHRPRFLLWLAACLCLGAAITIIISPYITMRLLLLARTTLESGSQRISECINACVILSVPDFICVGLAATAASYWLTARVQFAWWGELVALGAIVGSVITFLRIPTTGMPVSYTFFLRGFAQTLVACAIGGLAGGQFGRWLRARKR
jgi:hypothetical protein